MLCITDVKLAFSLARLPKTVNKYGKFYRVSFGKFYRVSFFHVSLRKNSYPFCRIDVLFEFNLILKMMMLKMMMLKMMMLKMMMPAWLFLESCALSVAMCICWHMLVILFQLADRLVWQMFLDKSKNTIQT